MRSAIVYLRGIEDNRPAHSLKQVTNLIAQALDQASATSKSSFPTGDIREVKIPAIGQGSAVVTRMCPITRKDDPTSNIVVGTIDVYEFNHTPLLISHYEHMSVATKGWSIVLEAGNLLTRILKSGNNPAKSIKDKIQLMVALGLLMLLSVYFAILIAAIVNALLQALQITLFKDTEFEWLRQTASWGFQLITLILTSVAIAIPTQAELVNRLNSIGNGILTFTSYLRGGQGGKTTAGTLAELLDYLGSQEHPVYDSIHLVSYSFGTILAIDALFPKDNLPVERLRAVNSLVTIASPFDFVRTMYPNYFKNRYALPGTSLRWANLWSPEDSLASNLRNDDAIRMKDTNSFSSIQAQSFQQEITISPESAPPEMKLLPANLGKDSVTNFLVRFGNTEDPLSWLEIARFVGLSTHSRYWDEKPEPQVTIFYPIITFLYKNTAILKPISPEGHTIVGEAVPIPLPEPDVEPMSA